MSNKIPPFQFDLYCGQQSYIYRTDSEKKAKQFSGLKELTAKTITQFLQDLHLKMGQYEIPLAPVQRKPKEKSVVHSSFKDQLLAKTKGKDKKKVEKMTEKQAQIKLFEKLRGKK